MEFERREQSLLAPITHQLIRETKTLTGREIQLVSDANLTNGARASYRASLSDEHRDILAIDPSESRHIDHLVAHELGHLRHFETVPSDERRVPVVSGRTVEHLVMEVRTDPASARLEAYAPQVHRAMLQQWTSGLVAQLANTPADIDIESNLHARPGWAPLQEQSLTAQVRSEHRILRSQVERNTPAKVWRASAAMTYALHTSLAELLGAPWMVEPYRRHPGVARLGRELLRLQREAAPATLDDFYDVSRQWNEALELPPLLDLQALSTLRRRPADDR